VIRETIRTIWKAEPGGIPGNDDLGAMSAWFVFAAMGMHPQTPGRAELLLASPLFPRIEVNRANGPRIIIRAPEASMDTFYVRSLRLDGRSHARAWLPESFVMRGGTLDYALGTTPNLSWGSAAADRPVSFGPGVK
jgi:putative alpha-1,2-mannosidase